ncbi:lipid droplet-associated protein [Pseudonocardia petroleophila]|uniref:Lipid droplet-associated protein n=1 Tax=Pseudonocardia petroleophila TaxID=37331 RepID=A0A7G7MK53_9PSEU|nr:lipid droplet-associated protein [Pseudonocardia petroleophila]QNG53164.1 lipid droplet-associated protein [Pseudonocardia petroleophila]
MKPLPLPVRLAAGIVALAVEQARDLPRLVVEFPVTAVSQALQASMRVQQKVTEVAIKGDRALGSLRPVEEKPSWATFDEDEPRTNGVVTALRPQGRVAEPPTRPEGVRVTDPPAPGAVAPRVSRSVPVVREKPVPTAKEAAERKAEKKAEESAADAPSALPEYPGLSIPQLRAKLRTLSLGDLRALLEWEQAHEARPPFVTMLSNRITTVSEA